METPTSWSELPFDILVSMFQQLSFLDFQRAKTVCFNWYLASKQSVKKGSPWLMLFPKNPKNTNCVLYNPEVNQFYKPLIDYSRFRFLANSGKWFLVITPQYNLCIIDLFTSERINLPPIESLVSRHNHTLQRIQNKKFQFLSPKKPNHRLWTHDVDTIRGLLWVDEKNKAKYVVVWYFYSIENNFEQYDSCNIAFCKNGYNKYVEIPINEEFINILGHARRLLLKDYKLYIYTAPSRFRILDLSGETFQDVTQNKTVPFMDRWYGPIRHLTVTLSGEVLLVGCFTSITYPPKILKFVVYKDDLELGLKNKCRSSIEVDSFGSDDDEALLIDLGVTTSVKDVVGIEPNCVYFSRHSLDRSQEYEVDICVFNLVTKTLKRFPNLSDMALKDARWFIPTLG